MLRFVFILLLILQPLCAHALDFPAAPKQRVNDYAGILKEPEKAELESLLQRHEQETSNQIVVAIFPSLEQESLEDFTNRLFERWRIGQKVNNNGVLLAVFLQDRKVRIEVGYGLEGKLTDALTSRIIRNELAPPFRNGQYGAGITAAAVAIQKAIAGEYKPAVPQKGPDQLPISPGTLIFLGFIFLYMIYRARNRGTYIDRRGRRRRDDSWFIFPGGFGSGGGGGWGGGGGGGFSGGGGMSGGGGASGSW